MDACLPPGLTFPTIKAQPRTDSGPVLCESPEADDVKTLFVRHTNGAPRYCTSGVRPSTPPFYICPVSSKTALTTSTQHNVLCQYDMLLLHRHCQQSAASQLMRAICVDFINLLGNVAEKHMCLQPAFSALKKESSSAIRLHGLTREPTLRDRLPTYYHRQSCTGLPTRTTGSKSH